MPDNSISLPKISLRSSGDIPGRWPRRASAHGVGSGLMMCGGEASPDHRHVRHRKVDGGCRAGCARLQGRRRRRAWILQEVRVPEGALTGLGSGVDWVWREDRINALLATEDAAVLFVSGCASKQGKFYALFDRVVLLSAPATVIAERLATRTNNSFGKDRDQLARTLLLQQEVEPLLRRGADMELDTTAPLEDALAAILRHVL
jgi:hypothetical protein